MGDCKGEELLKAHRWVSTLRLKVALEDSHGKEQHFVPWPNLQPTALSFRDQLKLDEVYVLFLDVYHQPEDELLELDETFELRLR